jgi:hypothetical protein
MTIELAKARLTIPDLWQRLDLPGQPKTSCKSPFREEKHASFSVSTDGQLWNDFGTNEGGDAVDFLRLATGLSPEAAFKKFIELAGGGTHDAKPLPKRPAPAPRAPQARQKPSFPDFERGTDAELHELAELRRVSFFGLYLARHVGLLRFATWKEQRAWIVTDDEGLNAQARRLDGEPWAHISAKAQTLPGSWASWPLGAKTCPAYPAFLLCEGGPDLLAALHFIHAARAEGKCFPLAMLGAGQRIHEEALPILAGKRVRIFPHTDTAGQEAAERWTRQLETVGAEVDAFSFAGLRKADGSPVGDLNDCTTIEPAQAFELEGLLP